jgi:hypothetical protein
VVVAGGLGTGGLVMFSLWRCLRGDVVIKYLTTTVGAFIKIWAFVSVDFSAQILRRTLYRVLAS